MSDDCKHEHLDISITCNNCEKLFTDDYMIISREEALKLDDYFCNRAGYISQEFDEAVHTFIGKMNRFLRDPN